jgi:RNA polymerase sigma-70 factor (ECF subfamily)
MMALAAACGDALHFGLAKARSRWEPVSSQATDAELVRRARRGEGEAIGRLVERYSPRLLRYLQRLVSDPALAEDLLQDTWLRVVERLDRYNAALPFVTWLYAVARNAAIDVLRQRARQARLLGREATPWQTDEGEVLEPLEQAADPAPSALEVLSERDLEQRVEALFATLPLHYREALALRFQDGMQLEEIARLLRVPLSTVKTRVQRGLILLRQRVEGMGLPAAGRNP